MKKVNKIFLELYEDRKQLLFVSFLGYICALGEQMSPSVPGVTLAAIWGTAIVGVASVGVGLYSSNQASKSADRANRVAAENNRLQNEIAKENLQFQKEQQIKLDKQKDVYRNMEFTNPYENMENVYEDLTVNQDQANFQREMFQQGQANIMQGLRGAAGSSGIAGLAQAMANQGQQASRQASLSIGQQERANEIARLGEAKSNDLAFRTGEASVEEREMNRQSTLLGMQMGQLSGANSAVMQSQQNQMASMASQANLYGQQAASQQGLANQMFSTGIGMIGDNAPEIAGIIKNKYF
jgi:hypothetical protein